MTRRKQAPPGAIRSGAYFCADSLALRSSRYSVSTRTIKLAKGLCSLSAKTFKSFFKSGSTRMLIGRIFFGALGMHTPYR